MRCLLILNFRSFDILKCKKLFPHGINIFYLVLSTTRDRPLTAPSSNANLYTDTCAPIRPGNSLKKWKLYDLASLTIGNNCETALYVSGGKTNFSFLEYLNTTIMFYCLLLQFQLHSFLFSLHFFNFWNIRKIFIINSAYFW